MAENKLLEQKMANFNMVMNRQEGAYVPIMTNNGSSSIAWLGKKTVDMMLGDPAEYIAAINKVLDEMWVDCNIITGNFFTPLLEKAFDGAMQSKYGPDGTTPEHVQVAHMKPEEYDLLIADPDAYVANVLLPRKLPKLFEDREAAKQSLKLFAQDRVLAFVQLIGGTSKMMEEKYGVVQTINAAEMFETPLDILFDNFRGFRGTLTDLRRYRKKVEEALDALWKVRCEPKMQRPVQNNTQWGAQFCHIPAYLTPKQFDELYWPYQKQQILRLADAGSKAYILLEGDWSKIWHHYLELPKDSCVLHVDDNDIVQAKKELGGHQIIAGGLKLADIRMKTFDQIKDDVKRIIDECAPGGAFLFTTDKCGIGSGDCNQTLIDTYNFVHEYSNR